LDDLLLVFHIQLGAGNHDLDVRTQDFCIGNRGSRFHAVSLRLITRSKAAGGIGIDGNDSDRAAAQFGNVLLLHRSEIGVEVEEEPIDYGKLAFGVGWKAYAHSAKQPTVKANKK